jgi:serine/threonine protein kinase
MTGMSRYFLLCGYTPFDRDTQYEEMQAIIRGDYKFEPVRLGCRETSQDVSDADEPWLAHLQVEYWRGVSEEARQFVRKCLTVDPTNRPTIGELLEDPWLKDVTEHYVQDPKSATGAAMDLLPQVKKAFDARKTCESASVGQERQR